MSRKIASAVQKSAHGELGRNITETVEDWIRENKSVPGLLLLRMVFKYYSMGRPAEAMFNLMLISEAMRLNLIIKFCASIKRLGVDLNRCTKQFTA